MGDMIQKCTTILIQLYVVLDILEVNVVFNKIKVDKTCKLVILYAGLPIKIDMST